MVPQTQAQGAALELILAHWNRADIEAVLDRVDTRVAASGLAWLLAQVIRLSGKTPPDFLAELRIAIVSDHLRRPPSVEAG